MSWCLARWSQLKVIKRRKVGKNISAGPLRKRFIKYFGMGKLRIPRPIPSAQPRSIRVSGVTDDDEEKLSGTE